MLDGRPAESYGQFKELLADKLRHAFDCEFCSTEGGQAMGTSNGNGVSKKVKAEVAEEQAWALTEEEIGIVLKELEGRVGESLTTWI